MNQVRIFGFSLWEIISAFAIAVLFLVAGYVSVQYMDTLKDTIGALGYWGILLYIGIGILATVIAPISATPLVPIVTVAWGPFVTGVLNVFAWSAGSMLAFSLARKYGYNTVGKFEKLKALQRFIEAIPENKLFITVLLVRLTVPADILSYALGLFSRMPFFSYVIATVIGITPFAFALPYTVTLPLAYQLLVLLGIGLLLLFSYRYYFVKSKKVSASN